MCADLQLADLSETYAIIQRGDLQDATFDEILNGSDAGPPIDGAERFVVAADDGNDGVDAFGLGEKELHKCGFDVRHVAGGDKGKVGPRGGEAGVDPDERAADQESILGRADARRESVEVTPHDDRLGEQGTEAPAQPVDDTLPGDREPVLREAQPLRLTAGEDDQRRRFAVHSPTLHLWA